MRHKRFLVAGLVPVLAAVTALTAAGAATTAPNGSLGYVTVDVAVTPDTAP